MRIDYLPYAAPLILTMVLGLFLTGYGLRQRPKPLALPFAACCLMVTIWSLFSALHVLSHDAALKITFGKLVFSGIVYVPIAWVSFALVCVDRVEHITRRNVLIALIIPTLSLIIALTNDLHGWMYYDERIVYREGQLPAHPATWGGWFWVHSLYSYVAIISGSILLIIHAIRQQNVFRGQVVLNVLFAIIPLIVNAIYIFGIIPLPVDLTPFAFIVSLSILTWNVFRLRLFNALPIAYRRIVQYMPDSVFVLDADHYVIELNPAAQRLLNVPYRDAVGRNPLELFPQYSALFKELLALGDGRVEVPISSADRTRWFEIVIAPIDDRNERGKLGIIRDITLRKMNEIEMERARDAAIQASQFKTQLISKVTHDLRTPLTAIRGYSELLSMNLGDHPDPENMELLGKVVSNTISLETMISTLLEQAKLDAGKVTLNEREYFPHELLDTARRSLDIMATSRGLTLTWQTEESLPQVLWGDPDRVLQIIQNLVGNALKFTEKGEVEVTLRSVTPKQWSIKVRDTGIGIPLDQHKVIFEAFRQLDAPEAPTRLGAGLGLSIVRELVDLMDGTIEIQSVVGKGSTFTVHLPIREVVSVPVS
jgi:PAS domain S-box-containing protein